MWKSATLTQIEDLSPSVKSFTLKSEALEGTSFVPGQFVTLELPIHEKRHKRWRSYSISSAPNLEGVFELCIVRVENGAGTAHLFDKAQVGDQIPFKGPDGVFTIPKDLATKDLCMICTGTGIAPFRSMLQHIYSKQVPHQKVHLVFGSRTLADVLYIHEFEELAKREPSFSYSVALSREVFAGTINGYVHEIYEKEYSANDNSQTLFYLCGWQKMIDEALLRLKNINVSKDSIQLKILGIPESNIRYEAFD